MKEVSKHAQAPGIFPNFPARNHCFYKHLSHSDDFWENSWDVLLRFAKQNSALSWLRFFLPLLFVSSLMLSPPSRQIYLAVWLLYLFCCLYDTYMLIYVCILTCVHVCVKVRCPHCLSSSTAVAAVITTVIIITSSNNIISFDTCSSPIPD